MSNSTTFPRGSNAANRFTPEQKLHFVGKLVRIYRKSRDAYDNAGFDMRYCHANSEQELHFMKVRRRADARMIRAYKCILALTAPAGGVE